MHELNDDQSKSGISENIDDGKTDRNGNIKKERDIMTQAFKRSHEADESSNKRMRTNFSKNSDVDTTDIGEACEIARQASSSFMSTTQTRNDETHPIVNNINERSVQEKDVCSLYLDSLGLKLKSLNENIRDMLMRDIDNLYFCAKYSIDQYQSSNEPMMN